MSEETVKRKRSVQEELLLTLRRPDLSVLGSGILSLPPTQWADNMLFSGVPDEDLRQHTGTFPATFRNDKSAHPVYVLRASITGHLVCPCSTRGNPKKQRYIKKDCTLEQGDKKIDRNSYLVESCAFTIPIDQRFSKKLRFRGIVPETCIVTPTTNT
jgi:hypothetical protein